MKEFSFFKQYPSKLTLITCRCMHIHIRDLGYHVHLLCILHSKVPASMMKLVHNTSWLRLCTGGMYVPACILTEIMYMYIRTLYMSLPACMFLCSIHCATYFFLAAAYTYYKSLCQEEAQKRKGMYGQRKVQRRRRERVVRVSYVINIITLRLIFSLDLYFQRCAERDSQFNRMSYTEADRTKWKKVLLTEYISSDESGEEDGQAVFFVKELTWGSVRVSSFFEKLDKARDVRKSEQASRQTKPRIKNKLVSSRPPPSSAPSWAIVK